MEWTDPPMVAGNWVPELVQLAGGEAVLASPGTHSPYLEPAEIAASEADLVVFMPCGFDLDRTCREAAAVLAEAPWCNLSAIQAGRVFAVDGNAFFNRPGPRLVESAEILRELFEVAEATDVKPSETARWRRLAAASS